MNQKPGGHVKSSDEYSDAVDDELTYFAEHEGEDKSAGRSVSRLEECVYRDPKLRCRKDDAKAQKGLLTTCRHHSGRPPTPICAPYHRHRTKNPVHDFGVLTPL